MATYVNNLRLTELATGEGSGTWGTTTNTSLELIGEALGYNTQNCFASDADATTTVADGATDPARAMYFKVTSSATLTATRTLTIAPNTLSRVMFIENATTGSQSIAISQGSGANVTIATGKTAVVYLDGAGSTAAVVDAMAGVDPGVTDTLAEVLVAGNTSGANNLIIDNGQAITTNTINETTAASGVTIDSVLLKDDGVNATNLEITNLKANDGTAAGSIANSTGVVTLASSVLTTADINGGTIDGTVIGGSTAAAGTFTTFTSTGIDDNATSTAITIDASRNVGIGTDSPSSAASGYTALAVSGSSGANVDFEVGGAYRGRIQGDTNGLLLAANGSRIINFFTNSAERMRIDSSGDVGIGVTSPDATLTVSSGSANNVANFKSTDGTAYISIADNSSTGALHNQVGVIGDNMYFATNDTERMRIDASGNVGIGVVPSAWDATVYKALQISTNSSIASFTNGETRYSSNCFYNSSTWKYITSSQLASAYTQGAGAHTWFTAPSGTAGSAITFTQAMTLDASGNLLVGTTSTIPFLSSSATGAGITSTGTFMAGATAEAGLFNRIGSDGSIANFYKAGALVGSIGTSGGTIYAGKGGSGLIFNDGGTKDLIPYSLTASDTVDNSISLGISSKRFKDLYLSGGVYLGGTGSANHLDDYEEGTWTPGVGNQTVVGSLTTSGTYTKVGRVVTVTAVLTATTSIAGGAGTFFTGLPFAPSVIACGVLVLNNRSTACWVQNFPTTTNVYINTGYSAHPQVEVTLTYIT